MEFNYKRNDDFKLKFSPQQWINYINANGNEIYIITARRIREDVDIEVLKNTKSKVCLIENMYNNKLEKIKNIYDIKI